MECCADRQSNSQEMSLRASMAGEEPSQSLMEPNSIMPKPKRKRLGRYIVADPEICHGKPTFRGTRIMVWQVLNQIARGMSWDEIVYQWRGSVSKKAIAEAIELAQKVFEKRAVEHREKSRAT